MLIVQAIGASIAACLLYCWACNAWRSLRARLYARRSGVGTFVKKSSYFDTRDVTEQFKRIVSP